MKYHNKQQKDVRYNIFWVEFNTIQSLADHENIKSLK